MNSFAAKKIIRKACEFPSIETVDWTDLFGAGEFFIFVNNAALYSVDLLEASKKFMGDFADRFEPQGISVEHHLIIGRYTQTPFGVHIDDATDRVFHFNLGPSSKTMILWGSQHFAQLYSGDTARSADQVSSIGSVTFDIAPQSAFFLPANYHHVGRSEDGVSIVVALAISRKSEPQLLRDASRELQELLPPRYPQASYYQNFEGDAGGTDEMFAAYDAIGLISALQHAQARRRSNKSFTEILPIQIAPLRNLHGVYTVRDGREPIAIKEADGLFLYSGGHRVILKKPELIREFERIAYERRFEISSHLGEYSEALMEVEAMRAWLVATGAACALEEAA
ncbi:UNVERIFIED_ORG: hypothetical protein ABIC54_006399 [Burkholderia sp. 1263]